MSYTPDPHNPWPWYDLPDTRTPLDSADLTAAESDILNYVQGQLTRLYGLVSGVTTPSLTLTQASGGTYQATVGTLILWTGGTGSSGPIVFPSKPADLSQIGIMLTTQGSVSAMTSGTDRFVGGQTTWPALTYVDQVVTFQYSALTGTWYPVSGYLPPSVFGQPGVFGTLECDELLVDGPGNGTVFAARLVGRTVSGHPADTGDGTYVQGDWSFDQSGNVYTCISPGVWVGPGQAPVPVAYTQAPQGITSSSAILEGSITPNGIATTYQFQYGTTASYGSLSPASPASTPGSGYTDVAVSSTIYGLLPGATYHYRLAATYSGTTIYGVDTTFQTLGTPQAPTVTETGVSAITGTSATISGTINPNGLTCSVYQVEYGAGSGLWTPSTWLPWYWQLQGTVPIKPGILATDMDMFDNTAATVTSFHNAGQKVIAYIDVGTYEPGRPDSSSLYPYIGAPVSGWPGEYWLDIRQSAVISIMEARIDTALSKGFDGCEFDNIDAYDNGGGGFGLTSGNAVTYVTTLTNYAHGKGLTVFQKNALSIVGNLVSVCDGIIDEEGNYYDEIDLTLPYIAAHKPVLNAEYVEDQSSYTAAQTYDNAQHIMGAQYDVDLTGSTFHPFWPGTPWDTVGGGGGITYGSTVQMTPNPGSGTSPVAVSANLTGLSTGTSYHARMRATNSAGSTVGDDIPFTTLTTLPAPTVTTTPAQNIAQTSAQLACTVNPNGYATTYYFQYGTTTSYGTTTASSNIGSGTTAVNGSFTISSGLTANTLYHFRAVATNANGTTNGLDATFTTLPVAATPPSNTALPVISPSSASVGTTLNCSQGSWSGTTPITYAYQWKSNGVAIVGATSSAYTVQSSDAGDTITCTVTATNSAGSSPATSAGVTIPGPAGTLTFNWNGTSISPFSNPQAANYGTPNSGNHWRGNFYLTTYQGLSCGQFQCTQSQNVAQYALPVVNLTRGMVPMVSLPLEIYGGICFWMPANWTGLPTNNAPNGYSNICEIFMQDVGGQPPWQLMLHNNNVQLLVVAGTYSSSGGFQYSAGKGNVPTTYAIPPGQFTLGAWNEITWHLRFASDTSGNCQFYYKAQGQSTWNTGGSISGIPTIAWLSGTTPGSGSDIYTNPAKYTDNVGSYTTQLSQATWDFYIHNYVIGTSLAVVQAAMP